MKLDLRAMLAGECRSLAVDFELIPRDRSQDRTDILWGVHFSTPLKVIGEITNTAGYMRMILTASVEYTAPCARCLRDVPGSFSFEVERTVAPAKELENPELVDELDEYALLEDGFLDMDDILLELLELNFPSKILCSENCLGLCHKCGKDLNEGKCNCSDKEIDPRLAPLAKLLAEMQKEEKEDSN